MSAGCDPHPGVIQPCANDAVGSLDALGTSGDIAYDQCGSVALTAGQTEVEVIFSYEKTSAAYVFEYLYVASTDSPPDAIIPVPKIQLTTGFTVELSGAPTSVHATLFWRVRIPDNLQVCQTSNSGPHYAIVPPVQEGLEELQINQESCTVTFPEVHPIADWMGIFNIIKTTGTPQIFAMILTAKSATGFTLRFQGTPEEGGYFLRWRIS